ncbi:alpha/beta hydrolase fold-domain-containing protein [Rhodocollybia butyracea]|uniref:Alpha/beta hydrolase fold-domain-containing protein n=1 Tax=Rhodocollybia butyracea TaxID=206335 RepID=A0A9P5UCD5_9AGAR|nr:alpha/beta hydrolase fold-domain-containing protein [Rhodocollybia butyracea]
MSTNDFSARVPKQPLHPSIISKLDPEYVALHENVLQYLPMLCTLPWDPVTMRKPLPMQGERKPLDVGKIEDFELKKGGYGRMMRAYTPFGEPPRNGWPVLVYFHGGGWTLGGLHNEQSIITNLCVGAKCIVISVDYRLAPEHKFPAAIDDAVEALQWVLTDGKDLLNIDTSKIATGGASSGANIAAVLALKAVEESFAPPLPAPMALQLLITPSVDQTATDAPGGRWESNKYAPYLPPAMVNWTKAMYFKTEDDWSRWEASPLLAPQELLEKAPKTWIAAQEMDLLCNECEAYAERLRECGVDAECVIYKGGMHLHFLFDGVLKNGQKGIADAVDALAKAFQTVQ